ncbi:class II glutamine amidotransferase [Microbacterium sp. NPDC091313]
MTVSRMLAYSSARARTWAQAAAPALRAEFAALARVHRDGWGAASIRDGEVRADGSPAPWDADAAAAVDAAPPAVHAMLYLRFASAGAAVNAANAQPFTGDGLAFQHNGSLAPRERALHGLAPADLAGLRGTTDSEVYFRHVIAARSAVGDLPDAVARAARSLRRRFPRACLNAFVLDRDALVVVHSAGSMPTPTAAFEHRGLTAPALPPAHRPADAASYHRLFARHEDGLALIATSGIDLDGWSPLDDDAVLVFRGGVLQREIPL